MHNDEIGSNMRWPKCLPEKVGLVTTYRCCWWSVERQNSSIKVGGKSEITLWHFSIYFEPTHINERRIFPTWWSFASYVPHYSSTNEKA